MSEQIELQSFRSSEVNDGEIEEYHEIDIGGGGDATVSIVSSITKHQNKFGRDYDFFTTHSEGNPKKANRKKIARKDEQPDIMDIINTELASNAVALNANVIEVMPKGDDKDYLRKWRNNSLFIKNRYTDSERGLNIKSAPIRSALTLTPIFPKVLENTSITTSVIPVKYNVPVKFDYTQSTSKDCNEQGMQNFLNITLTKLLFKSHHLFSLEILLSNKLLAIYEEYISVKSTIKDIERGIKVNRFTRNNLKQEFAKMGDNTHKDIRFDETIRKYTKMLFIFKDKQIKVLKRKKEVTYELLSLWSDVEMIREKCGKTDVPYELEIVKHLKDAKEYENEWSETLGLEIADLLDKIEFDYVTRYLEYKNSKRSKELTASSDDNLRKPKLKIDEDEVRKQAEVMTREIVQKENIQFYLKQKNYKNKIKADKGLFQLSFKFYVDSIFVYESEKITVTINNVLSLNFIESFSAQIIPNNSVLTLALCETNEVVASAEIDLQSLQRNKEDYSTVRHFIYDIEVKPNDKYVGSGNTIKDIAKANKVRLKSSNVFEEQINTVCEVTIKTTWDGGLNQNEIENVKCSIAVGNQLKRLIHGVDRPSLDKLKSIIYQLYNKDIDTDETLINHLKYICKIHPNSNNDFAVDKNSQEYTRFKLIHMRNKGGFVDLKNKMIPLHINQISTEQLNCLNRNNENGLDLHYLTEYENADPIELQRFISAMFVQNLNKNMLKHLHEHIFKKTHKDVMKEFQDLTAFFSNQGNSFNSNTIDQHLLNDALNKELKIQVTVLKGYNLMDRTGSILDEDEDDRLAGYKVRPLRPFVRVSYRGTSVQTATGIGCFPTWNQTVQMKVKPQPLTSLFVNIYDRYKCNIKDYNSDEEYSTHSRTVHYRFYNRWLGTVEVPLYSVLSLGTMRGTFKISTPPVLLGYETAQSKDQNESFLTEVSQLIKKELSFLTLQITTSLSNLGGLNAYNQPRPSNPEDDYIIKRLNNFVTEYVNDFPSRSLSLTFIDSCGKNKCVTQFLQPIPLPGYEHFPRHPKYRTESALSKSSGMSKSSSSKSSAGRKRELDIEKTSPVQEEKESVYSTYEGNWKAEDGQLTKLINTSLRYVALIPTYEVNDTYAVTLMGLELLKLLYGSAIDHTILLASFFLYLGIKSWIAIGVGVPRGRSGYVLTQFNMTTKRMVSTNDPLMKKKGFFDKSDGCIWYVYDACSGDRYELRDVGCPLKTVNYVFDSDNIWVNIQQSLECEHVLFDFSKPSDWRPVFDNTIFVMKQPIVTDPNLYSSPADVERLQEILDVKIRTKVQKWRPTSKTVWNRYCGNLLRDVLNNWEYWSFNSTEPKPPLGQKLKQLMLTHKVFGFPLNMPYVNTKSVIAAVKSTGIHNNADPQLEFGLAVQVYAYPNNVLSVWVFIASISRIQ